MQSFSNSNRNKRLDDLKERDLDLIVIGGGITGAGILLDAALRGLKVVLIEKDDFASGTSSKSTKLIHGGLRYLKQFKIGLVRESGLERRIAHNNACHLVHPEKMLLPIVKGGSFSKLTAGIAISVYDRLANVQKENIRKFLSKLEVLELLPQINPDILKGGIQYSEFRTDDARLTIEIIKAARRNSAEAFNYLEASNFEYENGKIKSVTCFDHTSKKKISLSAKKIVSATGPWADNLRKKDDDNTSSSLFISKGIHIVIPKSKLTIQSATYFDVFDRRMLFAIPRQDVVYIGTTDTKYTGDKNNLDCTAEDADYLLDASNKMFLQTFTKEDVLSSWAGLRPLIRKEGQGPSELSRKDEIFISDSGLISIAGGKLTGYRKMAKRIVDMVSDDLGYNNSCLTKEYKIHHNPFSDYSEYRRFTSDLISEYSNYKASDLKFLSSSFGKDAIFILEHAVSNSTSIDESICSYCINYESAYFPLDILERRTGWLYFEINKAQNKLSHVLRELSDTFNFEVEATNQIQTDTQNKIDASSLSNLKV